MTFETDSQGTLVYLGPHFYDHNNSHEYQLKGLD